MANICFSIANLSHVGGEERMCVLLANALVSVGHKVIIVNQNKYYWQKIFYKVDKRIKIYSQKKYISEYILCHLFRKKKINIYKYRRILQRNNIQMVIDVDTEMSLESSVAIEGLDIKLISWEHFCSQRFFERTISKDILRCINSKVDKLVVLTNIDRETFISKGQVESGKVCTISNPSPIQRDSFTPHSSKVILSMGRLEAEKGIDMLLQIWKKIDAPDWILRVVGEGSLKADLVRQVSTLGLSNVEFCPFTDNPVQEYADSSIFVLPSRHEGFPLGLLEALNMSLPIVAFDCPNGPREVVVDGVNGYLVPANNIDSFTCRLQELIDNKEKRECFGRNALGTVQKFRMEHIIHEWQSLINSTLC